MSSKIPPHTSINSSDHISCVSFGKATRFPILQPRQALIRNQTRYSPLDLEDRDESQPGRVIFWSFEADNGPFNPDASGLSPTDSQENQIITNKQN